MQFTTRSVFPAMLFALLALLSTVCSAVALPILQVKDVINPHITFPEGGETFTAGQCITVTWDTSNVPANSPNQGMIVLATPTADSENLDLDNSLASGFPLTASSQNITFPKDLPTKSNYAIVLFGDSGNISKNFTINAVA